MNPINILSSITVSTGTLTTKSGETGASSLLQKDNALFDSLLMGMTTAAPAEITAEQSESQSLLEMLSSIIGDLQELQQESGSLEEQEIIHEALQFLTLYKKQIEEEIKLHNQAAVNFSAAQTDQRMTETISPEKVELAELIRQLGQELQGQKQVKAAALTPLAFQDGEGLETLEALPKIVQLLKKVETIQNELRQPPTLEETEKPLFIARTEQMPLRPAGGLASPAVSAISTEPIQMETPSEPRLVPLAAESIKVAPLLQRTETSASPPTVRMSHLAEELGEVMRNSMRLTSSGETTQIRVNIFPEHLGHLDIRLTEMNGRIAAQIFTGTLAAKEVLDVQVNQMRNTLLQQGITLDKIEIIQQTSQQSMGQQQAQADQRFAQQQRKGNTSRDSNAYTSVEEESAAIRSRVPEGLMKVDYTV